MAQYQNPYGDTTMTATDEYGNPVHHTDQYGNPVHHQTGSANPYGATGAAGAGAGAGFGNTTATGMTGHHGTGHQGLHRSGSSSSSEDEVDENGVRRKKGMKDKIKEKIPGMGGHHQDKPHATSTTTPGGYGAAGEQHHEKKGVMDKIKEKLPGQH